MDHGNKGFLSNFKAPICDSQIYSGQLQYQPSIRSSWSIIPPSSWLTIHVRRITGEWVIWTNAQVQYVLHHMKFVHEYIVHCSKHYCASFQFYDVHHVECAIVHQCEQHQPTHSRNNQSSQVQAKHNNLIQSMKRNAIKWLSHLL